MSPKKFNDEQLNWEFSLKETYAVLKNASCDIEKRITKSQS